MELSITEQLQDFANGKRQMADDLARQIQPELRRIAVRALDREFNRPPCSATDLINEYWLRALQKGGWDVQSRTHFYSIAARVMRQVLIDFARRRKAQRRGNGIVPQSLDESRTHRNMTSDDSTLIEMGILMERLDQEHAEWARVCDLHYFAGFTLEEISETTGLSLKQIRYRWAKGRDWLKDRLTGPENG